MTKLGSCRNHVKLVGHALLTDQQKELEKGMQQHEHNGGETGDLLRPRQLRPALLAR
jgi:hypothetical protein